MQVWVVFIDADARRSYDEDLVCGSEREAKSHMADLRKMGFEKPVFKVYANESDYYDLKEAKGY